jgi:hypothetical protein
MLRKSKSNGGINKRFDKASGYQLSSRICSYMKKSMKKEYVWGQE